MVEKTVSGCIDRDFVIRVEWSGLGCEDSDKMVLNCPDNGLDPVHSWKAAPGLNGIMTVENLFIIIK